jgi:hypothetical protein
MGNARAWAIRVLRVMGVVSAWGLAFLGASVTGGCGASGSLSGTYEGVTVRVDLERLAVAQVARRPVDVP